MEHEQATELLNKERGEYFAKERAFDAECKKRRQELEEKMEKERAEMEAEIEEDRQSHQREVERRNRYLKEKDKQADAWILSWKAAAIKKEAKSDLERDVRTLISQQSALELHISKMKREAAELESSLQPAKKAKTSQY